MSKPCAISKCERRSRGLCDCCKQNLCLQHMNEHNAWILSLLNPLADEIKTLGDRLKSFKIDAVVKIARRKLETWRKDCRQKIDRLFEDKCRELDHLVANKLNQQRKEILRLQSEVAKLIREEEATRQDINSLTSTIRQLEKEMNQIEGTNIQVSVHSLEVNVLLRITETGGNKFDLTTLSPAYRTLNYIKGSWTALTTNDQFLLIHQKPNLCIVDQDMNIVKQVLWVHDTIRDMCWSSSLNCFIIVEKNDLFLLDERTMSIESIETIEKQKCSACVCSDTYLFVSTHVWGSSFLQLSLSPSIAIVKVWKSPITCTTDELISGMAYENKTCAMLINNKAQKSLRIELRSSETLERIWSLALNNALSQNLLFHCCSLNRSEWLVADHETKRLLHITKDGKLKTTIPYSETPWRITLFGSNMLVVSSPTGINLHKI